MTPRTHPTSSTIGRGGTARMVGVAVALTALGLSGCGVVSAAKKVEQDVRGNKATIDSFNSKLQTGTAVPFEATYVTTGSSPATVVYAVQPPKGLAFQTMPSSGSGAVSIIVNSTGEYSCTPPSSGSGPSTCQQLGTANAAAENQIFDFYTPSHWITFLRGFSLAAGIVGDKVTSSTMTVNGFALQCVNLQVPGAAGTNTICSTAQGILGYVKAASDSTSFEIKSYSASPSPSLFELPPGATVTTASTTP